MINIIVVADKHLESQGRKLAHEISKKEEVKAVLYTPKQYNNNENQISGKQHVIFIGNDNQAAKDFLSVIKPQYSNLGSMWGYDYRKAIIYIDEPGILNLDLEEEKRKLEAELNQIKIDIPSASINWLIYFTGGPIWAGFAMIRDKKIKAIRALRMELAKLSFLKNGFDEFIKQ